MMRFVYVFQFHLEASLVSRGMFLITFVLCLYLGMWSEDNCGCFSYSEQQEVEKSD